MEQFKARDPKEPKRSPIKPRPPAPRKRIGETRVRLTEHERDTLNRVCAMTGMNHSDVMRTTIRFFQPYLDIPGCMDVKYERVLASAIANPNAVTIQLLDNERTDILRHESNSLNGYAYEREIRDAVD